MTSSLNRSLARALLAAGSLLALAPAAQALDVGKPAPAFSLPQAGGGNANSADYKGKLLYVDFFASWCGPCKQSFPFMNYLAAKYSKRGLNIVGINVDEKLADADSFLTAVPPNFPIAFDPKGTMPTAFEVPGMPTSYLIGPDGKVLMVHSGFKDKDRDTIEAAIVAALPAAGAKP